MFIIEKHFKQYANKFGSPETYFISGFNRNAFYKGNDFLEGKKDLLLNIHGHYGNGLTSMLLMLANSVFEKDNRKFPYILCAQDYINNITTLSTDKYTQAMIESPYLFVDGFQLFEPFKNGVFSGERLATFNHFQYILEQRFILKYKTIIGSVLPIHLSDFLIKTNKDNHITTKFIDAEIKMLTTEEEKKAFSYFCKQSNYSYKERKSLYKKFKFEKRYFSPCSLREIEKFIIDQIAF